MPGSRNRPTTRSTSKLHHHLKRYEFSKIIKDICWNCLEYKVFVLNPFFAKQMLLKSPLLMCLHLQGFDAPGVEHIPVVQIDLSVPLKVPG